MASYPRSGVSQVFGLLDIVRSCKGKTDVARLNMDLHLDLDELLPTIDTAELLGFVEVRDGDISVTDLGRKVLTSSIQVRKKTIGGQLKRTELYARLLDSIKTRKRLERRDIAESIESVVGPLSNFREAVDLTIRWGVFAELFGYDGSSLTLPLSTAPSAS